MEGLNSTGQIIVNGQVNATSGPGAVNLNGRNVEVTGNISTASGNINLYGNRGVTQYNGTFHGVWVHGSSVNVNSTGGNITIDGRSGGSITYAGIKIDSATIATVGTGRISMSGQVDNSTYNSTTGINIYAGTLTTVNGSIDLNGSSNTTGLNSTGLSVWESSSLSISGAGNLNISGNANGSNSTIGIDLQGSSIITNNGTLTVNGISCGTASDAKGVQLLSATLSSTGTGNLNLTGTSGNGSGSQIVGFDVSGGSITTNSGSITIQGNSRAGSGTDNSAVWAELSSNITAGGSGTVSITGETLNTSQFGINLDNASGKIWSNGGQITLSANRMNLVGTVNATSSGLVLIQTLGSGVNLGGLDDSANLGLTQSELNKITSNMLIVGNSSTGAIVNTAAISRGNLTLISADSIIQIAPGNLTISGTANLVSSGTGTAGNITLNNATNDFGTVTASGTNITLVDTNNITLGSILPSGDLNVTAGNITITSNISNAGKLQSYTGAVINGAGNRALTAANVNISSTLNGADAAFAITGNANIVGSIANVTDLNVAGNAIFGSSVGAAGTVGTVHVTGTTRLGGNVTTTTTQDYDGAATLTGNATLTSAGNANITFGNRLDGVTNNDQSLTVNTAGITKFVENVGGTTTLNCLTTNAGGSTLLGANVTTYGDQTYNDTVTLTGSNYTTTRGDKNFLAYNTTTLAANTTISTGSGNVTFTG
ncbi:MAG: hypothetical protein WCJ40_12700, partial [Planctomycetota bacterium]